MQRFSLLYVSIIDLFLNFQQGAEAMTIAGREFPTIEGLVVGVIELYRLVVKVQVWV